jgi:hypothetical protein
MEAARGGDPVGAGERMQSHIASGLSAVHEQGQPNAAAARSAVGRHVSA